MKAKKRDLEGELLLQIRAAGLPEPERQRRVSENMHGGFKWDLYWPAVDGRILWGLDAANWKNFALAVEVMGNIYSGGHVRPRQYQLDCWKANAGVLLGVRVLRVTTHDVESGRAIEAIADALGRLLPARRPTLAPARRARRPKESGPKPPAKPSARSQAALAKLGLPARVLAAVARGARAARGEGGAG